MIRGSCSTDVNCAVVHLLILKELKKTRSQCFFWSYEVEVEAGRAAAGAAAAATAAAWD